MRWCIVAAIAFLLSIGPAAADHDGRPPPACEVPTAWFLKDLPYGAREPQREVWDLEILGASWRAEAEKIGNRRDVWRYLDRLYVATGKDDVTVLTDCPFGDGSRVYRYEKYDEVGDFHLVRTEWYEASGYTLVSRKTGLSYVLMSPPVWSPDRKRFFHARCFITGPNRLSIASPAADGLRTEISVDLPCNNEMCEFAWTDASTIAATCPGDDRSKPPKTLRLTLQAGEWHVTSK